MDLADKKKKLKKIVAQISGDFDSIDGDLEIPRMIVGSGVLYCYVPSTREFVKVNRGTIVYIIAESTTENDKYLVYTYDGNVVLLHEREMMPVGFN